MMANHSKTIKSDTRTVSVQVKTNRISKRKIKFHKMGAFSSEKSMITKYLNKIEKWKPVVRLGVGMGVCNYI